MIQLICLGFSATMNNYRSDCGGKKFRGKACSCCLSLCKLTLKVLLQKYNNIWKKQEVVPSQNIYLWVRSNAFSSTPIRRFCWCLLLQLLSHFLLWIISSCGGDEKMDTRNQTKNNHNPLGKNTLKVNMTCNKLDSRYYGILWLPATNTSWHLVNTSHYCSWYRTFQ